MSTIEVSRLIRRAFDKLNKAVESVVLKADAIYGIEIEDNELFEELDEWDDYLEEGILANREELVALDKQIRNFMEMLTDEYDLEDLAEDLEHPRRGLAMLVYP